jgi:hypothetical protein
MISLWRPGRTTLSLPEVARGARRAHASSLSYELKCREKQILRAAYPITNLRCSWGPKHAGSQDDTALVDGTLWTTRSQFA